MAFWFVGIEKNCAYEPITQAGINDLHEKINTTRYVNQEDSGQHHKVSTLQEASSEFVGV